MVAVMKACNSSAVRMRKPLGKFAEGAVASGIASSRTNNEDNKT